jgi:hypothetical protein
MNGDVMAQQMNEQTNKSDAIALTTPRSSPSRPAGGKIELRARLVIPSHTSCRYNTWSEKIFGSETFCGVVRWRRD